MSNKPKLILLAKVPNLDPQTKDACGYETKTASDGKVHRLPKEAIYAYFAEGFVSADRPRNAAYTEDITAAVEGWGLADASGSVIAEFPTVAEAEAARANATQSITLDIASE
jgi:hypothetical protein